MTEPKWLGIETIRAIHAQSVALFGGKPGIRDSGLLESALDRPRNQWHYGEDPTLYDLAAAYCAGILNNRPFVDGNKRAGLLAARGFLFLNGYAFEPDEAQEVAMIMDLAAGEIDESTLARWIANNAKAIYP